MKCPTCQIDNPKTAHFCQDCGTRLDVSGLAPGPEKGQAAPADRPSFTKTLDTPSGELPRGTVFAGRYEIIEELGTGGMGRVYRAYDRKIEEEIALKLIRPEIAAEKRTVERFRNEIKIARKITHKNVCRTHDLGEEGKGFFITMEYVRGEDLKSLIRRTRALASATAVAYARQVAEGLGEAHRLGIVHRDLKPGNIMIDKDGQAKIMDFGIARSLAGGGATAEGAIVGTPDYMSPEQVEGKPADQRADIYALGVILFEMVTGRTPFEGETVMAVAHKHLYEAAPDPGTLNPDIPAALGRLILRCLEKEREKRYQGTGELLADLEAVEAALPTAEHVAPKRKTITPREVTVKLPSRKVLVAAAAALALVVGGYAVWRLIIRPPVSPVPPGLPAAAAAAKKPLLAIPDFENISNDESLDYLRAGLPELLIPGLGQSRLLRVLRRDEIQEILKKLKLEEAKKYSIAQVKSISENGGASAVLTGSFMKAGDGILITVYLIDPCTGETVRSLSAKAGDEAAVMAEVDGLIPEIKRGLGLDPDAIAKDINKSVSQLGTASSEALKLYIEAHGFFERYELERSIPLFQKAIEIDPEFAIAHAQLAWAYHHSGRRREWMEHMEKAFSLADRMPEKDRLGIENSYYLQWEETYDKSLAAAYKLLELDPEAIGIYINIQTAYMFLREWEKVILASEEYFKQGGRHPYGYTNCALAYIRLGFNEVARGTLQEYFKIDPQNPIALELYAQTFVNEARYDLALAEWEKLPADYRATRRAVKQARDIHILMGDHEAAKKDIAKLESLGDAFSRANGFNGMTYLYLGEGQFGAAVGQQRQAIDFFQKSGEADWESNFLQDLAFIQLRTRSYREALDLGRRARQLALDARDLGGQRLALAVQGAALLGLGRTDEARKAAEELKTMIERGLNKRANRLYLWLAGLIALKEKSYAAAIDSFKQAIALLSYPHDAQNYDPLAEAYFASGDMSRAREEYEKITRLGPGRLHCGDLYAKAFYRLGLIAERTGDKAKAAENYRKFLGLWKNADPGLPEVEDAQKRLAGLKGA